MVGIYKIESPSGKVYIGQSWDILKRWSAHRQCKTKSNVTSSLLKYGVNAHQFNVVHELPSDVKQDVLDNYEQLYMDSFRDCGVTLLNITEGGRSGKKSECTKRKLSELNSGSNHPMYGIEKSQETRIRISIGNKGKVRSEEWMRKQAIVKKGNKNMLGKIHSDETRAKISNSKKGRVQSDVEKLNRSLAIKEWWLKRKNSW